MDGTARNVVLLTVDALRADHLSRHGYERATTPALDRFAAGGVRFTNASSPSSHTREAVPALLSGRYPTDAVDGGYALAADTVAAVLADEGFATGGFHSNPYVSRAYGFGAGFDAFDDDLHLGRHRLVALAQRALDKLRNRHYAPAETITARATDWLDGVDEPFFCWAHYMDPHGPYAPPRSYQEQFHGSRVGERRAQRLYRKAVSRPDDVTDAERREMVDCYDGEIRYTDESVDAFLAGLRDGGLLEDTLVVVTADHGDGFGEHGYYGHPRRLFDDLLGVPLFVVGPGVPAATVETPVSTLDVVPTILAGVGLESTGYPGTPLDAAWSADGSHPGRAFASVRGQGDESNRRRFSLRTDAWKVVLERDAASGAVLEAAAFDLRRDPGETDPLDPGAVDEGEATATLEALREKSATQIAAASPDAGEADDVDPAVAERLETLGYK